MYTVDVHNGGQTKSGWLIVGLALYKNMTP